MKKYLLFLLCFLAIANIVFSQEKPKEVNPELLEYLNSKSKDAIIPHSVLPEFIVNQKNQKSFPVKFDLREFNANNFVTSVKNQGNFGTCWTFATYGALESNGLFTGIGYEDFSEKNLATCHGYEWEPNDGGNIYISAAYLSRRSGPYTEIQDPYSSMTATAVCNEITVEPQFFVEDIHFIPAVREEIKAALLKYGALYMSYKEDETYYNYQYKSYCRTGDLGGGHAIVIVGWDDEYTTQCGKGAWIVKNSWGTNSRLNGYFYLSYQDNYGPRSIGAFVGRNYKEVKDTLLMYDKLGWTSNIGFGSNVAHGLTKFTMSGTNRLSRVGTYTVASNMIVNLTIYQSADFNDNNELVSLGNELAKIENVSFQYPGYHTVEVDVEFTDEVYVQVEYICTSGYIYPVPVETSIADYSIAVISENVSWLSSNGSSWSSTNNSFDGAGADICIRAYVEKFDQDIQVVVDTTVAYVGMELEYSLSGDFSDLSNVELIFGSGSDPVSYTMTSSSDKINVSYTSAGYKNVTATLNYTGGDSKTITRKSFVNVIDSLYVRIENADSAEISRGQSLLVRVSGANNYEWTSSDEVVQMSSNSFLITPPETKMYYVSATFGTYTSTDSIKIVVKNNPVNDDVCNAIELAYELNGPYSNEWASVQENEPLPELNSCTEPMNWCEEGGLQNSVWFFFYANAEGDAKITSTGFDLQMAVYSAEECNDLLSGDTELFSLIAANDDINEVIYTAEVQMSDLVPGTRYWVQIDGSAGGAEGEFHLRLSSLSTGTEELEKYDNYKIYPTYSKGWVTIEREQANETIVALYGIDGSLLLQENFNSAKYQLDISTFNNGLYILKIQSDGNVETHKIVLSK